MSISSSPASTRRSTPVAPGDGVQRERYIERQLEKTSFYVKLVDLCSAFGVLAAGVLGFLLIVAVVDHWIISLGAMGRWLALLTLSAGSIYYFVTAVVPLIFRPINPVYSARAIEHAEPSLKNSLVNFLLFRSDRAGVRVGIYQALEQRAAADLSHVNTENAVDRSRLIKIGYVLVVVLVVCAAYTILAPKSPFASTARVLAPWADIARPSRVRIEDVEPGNTDVFQGQSLAVSARCYDLRDGEPVTLFYSSLDGQLDRQSLDMQLDENRLRHECRLPADEEGLQRDLVYWIQAGDATTPSYRVKVAPAPSILVERIEYDYPAYTQLPKKVVEHRGDIQAVEGTRITLRARANQSIAAAVVEFDPDAAANNADGQGPGASGELQALGTSASRVEMEFQGQEAWCSFFLDLDDARVRSRYQSYRVRFLSEDGHGNPHPVLHRIHVVRDLSPEIEILTPETDRTEVPEDGRQTIEIRAIDPDFGVREIRLRAVAGGQETVNATLFENETGQTGQLIVSYDFQPRALGLRSGDSVTCWAMVEDNRCEPQTNSAAPNLAKTRDYTFVITPPKAVPERPEEKPPDGDPSSSDSGTSENPAAAQNASGDEGDANSGTSGSQGEDGSQGSEDAPSPSGDSGSEGTGSSQEASTGESGTSSASGATGQDSQGQGDSMESGGGTTADATSDGSSGDATGQDGTGGGSAGGSQSTDGSGSGGTADPSDMVPGGDGGREEPLHDGEAFEKALDYMSKNGQDGNAGASASSTGDDTPGSEASGDIPGSASESPSENPRPKGPGQEGDPTGADASGRSPDSQDDQQGGPTDEPASEAGNPTPGGGQRPSESETGQPQSGGDSGKEPRPKEPPRGGGTPQGSSSSQGKKKGDSNGGGDSQSGQGEESKSPGGESKEGGGSGSPPKPERKKQGSSGGGQPQSGDQSQTPDQSRQKSGGQGEDSSDRSGSGKAGSGQGSNQPGSDGPGSSSPSDQGAGAAEQSGSGDLSSGAGESQQGDGPTGQPGQYQGDGTESQPGTGGGGGTGPQGDSNQNSQTAPVAPAANDGRLRNGGQGVPYGGGAPSSGDIKGFDVTGEVPPGEKPNLEYARKATNLVLEYLRDQQQSPDQELLDELGWSEDDMQSFVERWESMKRSAIEDPSAQREMDDALRSLGLRPAAGGPRSAAVRDDSQRTARNIGTHSSPPPGYADQFNAYRKGTARTSRD